MGDKEAEQRAHEAIVVLLDHVKKIAARTEGYQWKITKFHELLHLVWYMIRYGGPRNFDAGMGEKNHKILAKWPASGAQKQYLTFDKDSMDCLHKIFVINRAKEDFLSNGFIPSGFLGLEAEEEATAEDESGEETDEGSSSFEIKKHLGVWQLYWTRQDKYFTAMPELLEDVVNRYFHKPHHGRRTLKYKQFQIFSQLKSVDGHLYWAHPSFRGRSWNDWVTIQ